MPRVLSAMVLLPTAVFCVWVGGPFFALLIAVAAAGLAAEWVVLCGYRILAWPGIALPVMLAAAAACAEARVPLAGLTVLVAGGVITITVGRLIDVAAGSGGWKSHAPYQVIAVARSSRGSGLIGEGERGPSATFPIRLAAGFLYFGLPAIALIWLREDPAAGRENTFFMLSIVWASDIGAYMVGRLIGGPRLAPTISPGKTCSGAAGGLISAALAGLGFAACLSSGFSPSQVVVVAIGLGLVAQAGDLLESALKRDFGVKDSGRIIPGHGGLLDRLDALLAAAPAAALLAFTVGRGVVLWR